MMLSSTMRTLIGGTVPSINPPNTAPGEVAAFVLRTERGDETAGGVCDLTCGDSATGTGGVEPEGAVVVGGG
jgi:hypothetical protein